MPREQGEMQKNVKPTLPASHLSALLFHDEVPLSKDSFPHCPTIVRLLSISIVTISLKLKRAVNKSSWAESTPGGYLPVIRQPTNGWFTYVLVDEATQGMKLEWPISMVSYHIGWIAPPKLPEVRSYCNHLELSHPLQQQENAWVQVWHTKQGFSRKTSTGCVGRPNERLMGYLFGGITTLKRCKRYPV